MCGICVVLNGLSRETRQRLFSALCSSIDLNSPKKNRRKVFEGCLENIGRRGPTSLKGYVVTMPSEEDQLGHLQSEKFELLGHHPGQLGLHFYSSVLHLRGAAPTVQPLMLPNNNDAPSVCLMWNGEVFGGRVFQECESHPDLSDTEVVGNLFLGAFNEYIDGLITTLTEFENRVLQILEDIEGPFSTVILFGAPLHQLWIARDKIGRRSLCLIDPNPEDSSGMIIVSSVGPSSDGAGVVPFMGEIAVGVTILDLSKVAKSTIILQQQLVDGFIQPPEIEIRSLLWNSPVPFECEQFWSATLLADRPLTTAQEDAVVALETILLRAVERRIVIPKSKSIALMFSGGVDSGILLALLLKVLPSNSIEIDLLNVAFGNPLEAPDRFTALSTYDEVCRALCPQNQLNFIAINITKDELRRFEFDISSLLYPKCTHMDLNIGAALYFASRGSGLVVRPDFSSGANSQWWFKYKTRYLAENSSKPRSGPRPSFPSLPCMNCQLVRKPGCSFDLCRLCCERRARDSPNRNNCSAHWRFSNGSNGRIGDSNIPLEIGEPQQCLYFRTDEVQVIDAIVGSGAPWLLETSSPVVLVGHGADELFGGYGRYDTARRHGGGDGARSEMIRDLGRLWERNLGRDDRCIAHWGRESRHPFLDEELIRFVGQLPFELLHSPNEDKPLLRQLARRLHLVQCSHFKKRAIQFGSRSSRMSNKDHFPSHRKANGNALYTPKDFGTFSEPNPDNTI